MEMATCVCPPEYSPPVCVCLSAGMYLVSFEPYHFPHIDLALTVSPHLDFRAGRRIVANLLYVMPSFVCIVCVCVWGGGGGK